jgi:hypothetical protein
MGDPETAAARAEVRRLLDALRITAVSRLTVTVIPNSRAANCCQTPINRDSSRRVSPTWTTD